MIFFIKSRMVGAKKKLDIVELFGKRVGISKLLFFRVRFSQNQIEAIKSHSKNQPLSDDGKD